MLKRFSSTSRRWVLAMLTALATLGILASLPWRVAAAVEGHESALAGVKELEKRVSYTETKIPLGELVEKVARDTGIRLSAVKEVADEPVAVVVTDFPARRLLDEV